MKVIVMYVWDGGVGEANTNKSLYTDTNYELVVRILSTDVAEDAYASNPKGNERKTSNNTI